MIQKSTLDRWIMCLNEKKKKVKFQLKAEGVLSIRAICVYNIGVVTAGGEFKEYLPCHNRIQMISVCFCCVTFSDVCHLWHEFKVIIVQMINNTEFSCTRPDACLICLHSPAGTQADWHGWPYSPALPESWLEMRRACKWALLTNHQVACSCEPD